MELKLNVRSELRFHSTRTDFSVQGCYRKRIGAEEANERMKAKRWPTGRGLAIPEPSGIHLSMKFERSGG